MPDWIVWLVVGFIVYRFCVAGGGGSCGRSLPHTSRRGDADDRELSGGSPTRATMHRGAGRRAETPIQAAQRRFVEGATTVEEYEAELDRALRNRQSSRQTVTEAAPRTSRL